jgi:putative addiction module component (TIGR02574 family)
VTDRKDALNGEVEMANLAEVLRNAMSLVVHDRATLAERLLASLEELSEEEAERLWAEEAQRRLEEYRAGRAQAVPAEAVHEKAARLFR